MFEIVCVTNSRLCNSDFFIKLEEIARAGPDAIMLREKEVNDEEYLRLAERTMRLCADNGVRCILHGHTAVARALRAQYVHLPLADFEGLGKNERTAFGTVGISCHSTNDIMTAERLGAKYVTFGHIYATDCKRGAPPRGIEKLKGAVEAATVPVWAIGGINAENIAELKQAGASGACIMSGFMTCKDAEKFIRELRNKTENI